MAADCNDGLVKEGHPESKLLKGTFLPHERVNPTGFPLCSIPAGYPKVVEDASCPRQRAADTICYSFGSKRLTTSEFI